MLKQRSKEKIVKGRITRLVRKTRWLFGERQKDRQSMYSWSPGPLAGVLLTFAQPFPSNCPHREAVMDVCRHRKEEAEHRTP